MKIRCRCGASYNVKPEYAGKKVKCKQCAAVFEVPSPVGVAAEQVAMNRPLQNAAVTSRASKPTRQTDGGQAKQKRAREDALLAKYSSEGSKTLDERIAERQKDSTERDRVPNAIKHFLLAVGCLAAAVLSYFILAGLENGGVAPRIVWALVYTQGKYWVPVLLVITALYQCLLAVWFLNRKSNVDSEGS